jgi:hypothetical protein
MLLLGVLVMAVPAQILFRFKRPSWVDQSAVVDPESMVLTRDEPPATQTPAT